MRYLVYKIHILYNNVRCERATRICVQMCAPTCHDAFFNILFLIKVGKCDKMPRFACDAQAYAAQ